MIDLAPPMLTKLWLDRGPALHFWVQPEFRLEDVDYANRFRVVLVVHHPATHAPLRAAEDEVPHQLLYTPEMLPVITRLIERANSLIPPGR